MRLGALSETSTHLCTLEIVEVETTNFQELMDNLYLSDMKSTGRFFTWTNRRVWSKTDRVLCNLKWIVENRNVAAQYK